MTPNVDWDEMLQRIKEIQEQKAFLKLKEERKIEPVVLIAHPKFKSAIHEAREQGADITVLYSCYADEDKIYQVTDPAVRKQIIELLGRRIWQERLV